jgi:hypothetical protein
MIDLQNLFAFWAGGAVVCMLFTREDEKFLSPFLFSLAWPITVIYGMALAKRRRQ